MTTRPDLAGLAGLTERSVSSSGPHRAVRLGRIFGFTREEVWDAITDPERLRRWIGEVSGDLREGGSLRLAMSPDDTDVASLTVVRCDRPRRLTMQWSRPGEDQSLVDVELTELDGARTELVLDHLRLTDAAAIDRGAGWEDLLARLDGMVVPAQDDGPGASNIEVIARPLWQRALVDAASDRRWPLVEALPAGTTITVERFVAAPARAVWTAITDAQVLTRWFATMSGDLSLHGSWTADFDGGTAQGTVNECLTSERLVTTWAWDHDAGIAASLVTITLAEVERGTQVTVRQEGVHTPAKGYAAGWYAYLRALDADVARGGVRRDDWQADWERAMAVLRD